MTRKQMEMHLKDNGFFLHRNASKHYIWTDGRAKITLSKGKQTGWRNIRAFLTDVKRAVKTRPEEPAKKEEIVMHQIGTRKGEPLEASLPPGVVERLRQQGQGQPTGASAPENKKYKEYVKYDYLIRRRLEQKIMELYQSGIHDHKEMILPLHEAGFRAPDGVTQLRLRDVHRPLNLMLESGLLKQVVVTPPPTRQAPPVVAAPRKSGRLPDAVMSILTDPELTADQKVRMCPCL